MYKEQYGLCVKPPSLTPFLSQHTHPPNRLPVTLDTKSAPYLLPHPLRAGNKTGRVAMVTSCNRWGKGVLREAASIPRTTQSHPSSRSAAHRQSLSFAVQHFFGGTRFNYPATILLNAVYQGGWQAEKPDRASE